MKIVIIILGILITTGGAGYSYYNRALFIQAALYSEGFELSDSVRQRVEGYYDTEHVLPHDNSQTGVAPAHAIYGTSVKRVSVVRDGVVLVQFNEDMNSSTMVFTPKINIMEGTLSWSCSSDSIKKRVLSKLRPACVYTPATVESELMHAIANQDIGLVRAKLNQEIDLESPINGNTPLMLAAKIGNVDVVSQLLEAGAKVDHFTINAERRTALMVAISNERADIVSLLLSNGASVDRKDYSGKSAMDYARLTDTRNGDERFQLMLAAQFNPLFAGRSESGPPVLSPDQLRLKLRSLHSQLEFAAVNCHGKRLQSILEDEGELVDAELFQGAANRSGCASELTEFLYETSLWHKTVHATIEVAIDACDPKTAESTLAENPDLEVFVPIEGESFVFRAVRKGCTDVLNLLLRKRNSEGQLQSDLLTQAIKQVPQHALLRTVTALIEAGADINAVDEGGMSPLATAIAFEQPVIAKFLIDAGADVQNRSPTGSYPLIEATKKGYHHLVNQLLKNGADVNMQDGLGRTALHAAVGQGRSRTVNILLSAGVNRRLRDNNGIDAVVMAKSKQFTSIHTTLLED